MTTSVSSTNKEHALQREDRMPVDSLQRNYGDSSLLYGVLWYSTYLMVPRRYVLHFQILSLLYEYSGYMTRKKFHYGAQWTWKFLSVGIRSVLLGAHDKHDRERSLFNLMFNNFLASSMYWIALPPT